MGNFLFYFRWRCFLQRAWNQNFVSGLLWIGHFESLLVQIDAAHSVQSCQKQTQGSASFRQKQPTNFCAQRPSGWAKKNPKYKEKVVKLWLTIVTLELQNILNEPNILNDLKLIETCLSKKIIPNSACQTPLRNCFDCSSIASTCHVKQWWITDEVIIVVSWNVSQHFLTNLDAKTSWMRKFFPFLEVD